MCVSMMMEDGRGEQGSLISVSSERRNMETRRKRVLERGRADDTDSCFCLAPSYIPSIVLQRISFLSPLRQLGFHCWPEGAKYEKSGV